MAQAAKVPTVKAPVTLTVTTNPVIVPVVGADGKPAGTVSVSVEWDRGAFESFVNDPHTQAAVRLADSKGLTQSIKDMPGCARLIFPAAEGAPVIPAPLRDGIERRAAAHAAKSLLAWLTSRAGKVYLAK